MGPGADASEDRRLLRGSVEHFDWLVDCGVPFKAAFWG